MAKRWLWGVPAGITLGFVAFSFVRQPELPTARFPDGRSARVLKVSFGTNHVFSPEPLWKKSLRVALPERFEKILGPLQRSSRWTEHDTLAIFIEPLPKQSGIHSVRAIFPDGTGSSVNWLPGHPIIFGNYPRGEKEIVVSLSTGSGSCRIKVPNPRPAKRQSWTSRALPQTNSVIGTEVILEKCRFIDQYVYLFLDARSAGGGPVGWMQWQTALFDPLGNYQSEIRNKRPYLPGGKNERDFRVVATGMEYIPAGFINTPVSAQYQTLTPGARATNWGVQFLAALWPGTYEISKTFAIKAIGPPDFTTNTIQARNSGWVIRCADPVALSISTRPIFEMRFRERIGADGGRIFAGRRSGNEAQGALVAQVFTPRLPAVTANLEVEVIVRWPPAEFFVRKAE